MSAAEEEAKRVDKAKEEGRAEREKQAAESLGLEQGDIVERTVYVGPGSTVGMVETICVRCARIGHIPESWLPANLTERPVAGLCSRCQPKAGRFSR